jgi:hypothetical protein
MRRVTPRKKLAAFRLDPELISGPEEKKERTGALIAEQVRRAIARWNVSSASRHGISSRREAGEVRTLRKGQPVASCHLYTHPLGAEFGRWWMASCGGRRQAATQ